MDAIWQKVVLIEILANSFYSEKQDKTFQTFRIHMRNADSEEFNHTAYVNEDKEGNIKMDFSLTQIYLAVEKPSLIKALKEAIQSEDTKRRDSVIKNIRDKMIKLGALAKKKGFEKFAKMLTKKLKGNQIAIFWRAEGANLFGSKQRAGFSNSQLRVLTVKQSETVKGLSIEDFVNKYKEGSLEERNKEAISKFDEFEDDFEASGSVEEFEDAEEEFEDADLEMSEEDFENAESEDTVADDEEGDDDWE